MAATQAELTSEVTCDSDLNVQNLQNGTEKGGGRAGEAGGVNSKGKSPGLSDMSQYRPEHSEPHANSVEVKGIYHPGDPAGPGDPMQGYYPRTGYHHSPSDAHNSQVVNSDGNAYGQFGAQPGMRHGYPGGKGMAMGSPRPPAQPSGYGPGPQRFMSGQNISQAQGPTPTLNQLLQSNQPQQQHYQNSYDYHGWGQRPGYQPPGAAPYRNQPPTSGSPRQGAQQSPQPQYYGPSGGAAGPQVPPGAYPPAPSSPSPQQQQQQPQQQPPQGAQYPPYPGSGRYPAARQPFSHQQIPSSYCNQQPPSGPGGNPPSSGYPDHQPQQPPSQQGQQQQQQQQQGPPGGQTRQGWPHPPSPHPQPPQSPGHGPETSVPVPRPSPGPQASPSHSNHPPSPGPSPAQSGPPPSQSPHQQGSYPQRPQQASTPTAHAPDQGELSGANSNDSNSGHAGPATPNSGMRPTPSPTGSTGSRSMSPAVGQQNIPMPPRPSSGQSEAPPPRLSHSPLTSGGGYPQHPQHPQHQYKQPPYPQPNYSPRPGPGAPYSPAPAGYPQQPNSQYPSRPHQPVTNHTQYPGYQTWGPQQPAPGQMMANHVPPNGKAGGAPPSQAPPSPSQPPANAVGPRPHTPPLYLKQHLQHKMGFSGPPPPQGQGGYPGQGMGPPGGMHHPMGPPPPSGMHHPGMGPPPPQNMGPPHEMPPPPSSTPNSHPLAAHMEEAHDNGITTTAGGGGSATHVSPASLGSVTSVVTTGPDGQPMDEGSQQSTLSNASAASGEEAVSGTSGKARKEMVSHPATPQSTAPSPGSASANSVHEDYDVNSSPTSWPRTPNSPVFNSHVPSDTYRSGKQPDSLSKLYEMDDAPERRHWLDRLLAFMDERRNPITACPTISKNPLDLFRLYLYVKERGGFMEVTKNKTWKDIAGLLGIGASSSAAYTLRKHYTKNLLAYECHFDRGGIDPQPIINQVEAQSKKKGNKVISVPSPGSSNSQDSFPAGGNSGSMDGYPGYPGYPPGGANAEYPGSNQRPSQPTQPSPIPGGMQPGGYPGQAGYPGQYPDSYGRSGEYNQQFPQQGYPPSRPGPMYPQYPPSGPPAGPQEGDARNYPQGGAGTPPGPGGPAPATGGPPAPAGAAPQDQYRNYPGNYSGPRPGYPTPAGASPNAPAPGAYPPGQPPQQDYYRQEQVAYAAQGGCYPQAGPYASGSSSSSASGSYPNSQLARQLVAPQQAYGTNGSTGSGAAGATPQPPGGASPAGKTMTTMTMPPPAPQPRRHPDFSKEQQPYQGYPGPRPGYGPWPNSQFRQQYPQQWQGGPRYPTSQAPPNSYPPPQPMQSWGNSMPVPGVGQSSPLRPAGPRPPFRPQCPQAPPNKSSSLPPGVAGSKRELQFPAECVESVSPVLYKRRRLNKLDVAPLEAWRVMMALRSGLLAETTWAIDILNILLFDDSSVAYFGLNHMPGLLEVLLEHWRKTLDDVFEQIPEQKAPSIVDLGEPTPEPGETTRVLPGVPDRTLEPVRGRPVVVEPRSDLFVKDGRRNWDVDDDSEPPDPAAHIISPYSGEFVHLPFARRLPDGKIFKTEPSERTEPVRLPIRRRKDSHCEDECYSRDESSLLLATEAQDSLARRCVCLSTILRNLSFVPGNEAEMARSVVLLGLLGRLLLLHHDHPPRVTQARNYDREEDADFSDSCSSLQGESEWWWDYLHHIRENVLVTCANVAGHMDLSLHPEELSRPLLDGLLHWAVCPAAAGQDAFPTVGQNSVLSPQRLALEALCKLCVTDGNVDLLVATPPYSRLERLCGVLSRLLCRGEDQVLREMSVNLLHYLSSADSCMARTIALQPPSVSLLLSFVEQAEQSALGVANQLGINALRDNPESMGTSLDMLRRAAGTLLHLARHPDNRPLFVQHEPRLLQLVMSQILDQQVACVLARVLFQVSRPAAVS